MPLFGKNWQEERNALLQTAMAAKGMLQIAPGEVASLLMGVTPAVRQQFQKYLDHFDNRHQEEELAKYPEDHVGYVALRLLCMFTESVGIVDTEWKLSTKNVLTWKDLSVPALPALDQLVVALVQEQDWQSIARYRPGGLMASAAQSTVSSPAISRLGGVGTLQIHGLYAQGSAALRAGDMRTAKLAWAALKVYGESSNDPMMVAARKEFARL